MNGSRLSKLIMRPPSCWPMCTEQGWRSGAGAHRHMACVRTDIWGVQRYTPEILTDIYFCLGHRRCTAYAGKCCGTGLMQCLDDCCWEISAAFWSICYPPTHSYWKWKCTFARFECRLGGSVTAVLNKAFNFILLSTRLPRRRQLKDHSARSPMHLCIMYNLTWIIKTWAARGADGRKEDIVFRPSIVSPPRGQTTHDKYLHSD